LDTVTERILVYGFKPYGQYRSNISEQVLSSMTVRPPVFKRIFEVRFDAAMFHQALRGIKPALILGLGQHPRARKLRIERKAKNVQKNQSGKPVLISRSGPAARFATLLLPRTALTTVTYDAGSYVCNYSMYLMGEYCEGSGARFGFLHIPKDHDLPALARYLNRAVSALSGAG
jgi:pyrrolidone-carboxylate peptidase